MKDRQDHRRPIHHLGIRRPLEIPLLRWRQIVIDQHHRAPRLVGIGLGIGLGLGIRIGLGLGLGLGIGIGLEVVIHLLLALLFLLLLLVLPRLLIRRHFSRPARPRRQLLHLPLAQHQPRGQPAAALGHLPHHLQPERRRQPAQLRHGGRQGALVDTGELHRRHDSAHAFGSGFGQARNLPDPGRVRKRRRRRVSPRWPPPARRQPRRTPAAHRRAACARRPRRS